MTKVIAVIAIIAVGLGLGCGHVVETTVPKIETVRCPVGKPVNTLPVREDSVANSTPALDDLIDMANAFNSIRYELVTCRDLVDAWDQSWDDCE